MHFHERPLPVNRNLPPALLSIVLLCLLGSPAAAQQMGGTSAAIQRLEMAFWPEYDKPQVLVMYRGELDPSTLLPAQVALPIPVEVGKPHAVAWRNAEGGLMMAQHTLDVANGQAILNITVPSHSFRVEYYQDIGREGDHRSFTFTWPGGPGILALAYEIQQPLGATDFEVRPMAGSEGVGGDTLTYLRAELGAVAPGEAREIGFSYSKTSDAVSVSSLAPAMPPPPPASLPPTSTAVPIRPPSSGGHATQWWPIYVAIALLVGLLAGVAMQRRKR